MAEPLAGLSVERRPVVRGNDVVRRDEAPANIPMPATVALKPPILKVAVAPLTALVPFMISVLAAGMAPATLVVTVPELICRPSAKELAAFSSSKPVALLTLVLGMPFTIRPPLVTGAKKNIS